MKEKIINLLNETKIISIIRAESSEELLNVAKALKEGGIEVKLRHESEKSQISVGQAVEKTQEIVQGLYDEVLDNLEVVEFKG